MASDDAPLVVLATKPTTHLAVLLKDLGLEVRPIEGEERSNIDRYLLSPQVAVEHRTWTTFLLGIQDKTLFLSALYLRENFANPVLVVEGAFDHERTGFTPQAVRGALSAMILEYGVSVLSTTDSEETARLLAMMARHAQVGVPEISLVPKRKAVDLPDLQRRVVEMLPGCGRVTARDLLQHFGSISAIFNASESQLREVHGIGEKRAAEIHRVLHAPYRAVDTERNLEEAIEARPDLLFSEPMDLLARQHVITTDDGGRHVVDLIFRQPQENTVILVELKYGQLTVEHEVQLRRYFEVAAQSPLLSARVSRGSALRGVLATVSPCDYDPASPRITARIVDEGAVIDVLAELREQRRSAS